MVFTRFERWVAIPEMEYAQLKSNEQLSHPLHNNFDELSKDYKQLATIYNPHERIHRQGGTLDEIKNPTKFASTPNTQQVIENINSLKSKTRYDDQWEDFLNFCNLEEKQKPEDENFILYFNHLKTEKEFASSSLWAKYSMMNYKMQAIHRIKLQSYPRLTALMKSFGQGYVRKAAGVFTSQEIENFIKEAPDNDEFIYMKTAVIMAYCGGLRCADLVNINISDMEFDECSGTWVNYEVSKQYGQEIRNKFNIPLEFCQYLKNYDKKIYESNVNTGRLMKTFRRRKNGDGYFTNQPMGVNTLAKITVKMAEFLHLEKPETYSDHVLRRSATNRLAEQGATTMQLKKHFNWKSEMPTMKYLENTKKSKLILSDILKPSTSEKNETNEEKEKTIINEKEKTIIRFENCSHIVFHM